MQPDAKTKIISHKYKDFLLTFLIALGFLSSFALLSYLAIVPEVEHRNLHDDEKNGQKHLASLHLLLQSKSEAIDIWQKHLIQAEKEKLRGVVSLVAELIESESQLSLHANTQEFLEALSTVRFDQSHYFWIVDKDGKTLSHPKAAFTGKSLDELVAMLPRPIGESIYNVHMKISNRVENGELEGYAHYRWTSPTTGTPIVKTLYYRYMPERQWYLMSAFHEERVEARINHYRGLIMQEIQQYIRDYRFGANGYFWAVSPDQYMIFHPNPDFQDRHLTEFDTRLNPADLYQKIIDNADSGKPFIYQWPAKQSDLSRQTPKVAWSQYFEPFDIYIGSTIEMSELNANTSFITARIILLTAFGLLLSIIAGYLFQLRGSFARKKQEAEKAQAANDAKSLFIAQMSHEIRTPLNGVIGALDLIQTNLLDPSNRRLVNIISRSSGALMQLINDILDYSKADAGKTQLKPSFFNLPRWLETIAQNYQVEARLKEIDFVVDCQVEETFSLYADPLRLRQILGNLLNNAIKFTDQGQVRLTVSLDETEQGDAQLRFTIHDSGIGVAERHQKDLFEVFTQADISTTRVHGGTGLGLAICKKLVDLFGGQIDFSSELHEGSTFWFSIPVTQRRTDAKPLPINDGFGFIDPEGLLASCLKQRLMQLGGECASADQSVAAKNLLVFLSHYDSLVVDALLDSYAEQCLHLLIQNPGELPPLDERVHVHIMPVVRQVLLLELEDILEGNRPLLPNSAAKEVPMIGRVLIAEDNQVNAMILTRMLSNMGLESVVTTDGVQAVANYREYHDVYDLVLLDLEMPLCDGIQAAQRIRALEQSGHLPRKPVVILTAHTRLAQSVPDNLIDKMLSKPLEAANLQAALHDVGVFQASEKSNATTVEPDKQS